MTIFEMSQRYLVAVFGEAGLPGKTLIESGCYPSEPGQGFWPHKKAAAGDFILLYCAKNYPDGTGTHMFSKTIAGLGIVISSNSDDGLRYKFVPLRDPIPLRMIRSSITREENQLFSTLHLPTNWLFEVGENSFWRTLYDARIGSLRP